MYFVYAMVSRVDERIYIGMTSNLQQRLKEHNAGKTSSTRHFTPWEIFYTEKYENRQDARKREKYFKSGIGRERLREKWQQRNGSFLNFK